MTCEKKWLSLYTDVRFSSVALDTVVHTSIRPCFKIQEDKGSFWGYWRRTQKLRGRGGVFLHCDLMRSNPVLVFEVVDFLIFVSHLILNILNTREGGTGPVSTASIKPSSYSSSSVGSSSSMSRSSLWMLRFWVTDAIRDMGLLSSISAGSSFTWTWCLKQK